MSEKKDRFEVKKWNAVALWSWDVAIETCAICRNHIMDKCIECQADQEKEESNCNIAWVGSLLDSTQEFGNYVKYLGKLQPWIPLSLHLSLDSNAQRLPPVQH